METKPAGQHKRIHFLDEVRGLCVLLMIIYHALYAFGDQFEFELCKVLQQLCEPLQPFFAGLFILISGISSRLSRSNARRGVRLLCVAAGLTAVSVLIVPILGFSKTEIWFGVLHLLSVSMLLFALLRPLLNRVPPAAGAAGCFVLFVLTCGVPSGYVGLSAQWGLSLPAVLYSTDLTAPLGFATESFYSADYFPLLPNLFMFLCGTFLGAFVAGGKLPESLYIKRAPPLSWLGRHALIICLFHWVIIFVLGLIIQKIYCII